MASDDLSLPGDLARSRQLWRTDIPPGNSTPCLVGDQVFLTTWNEQAKQLATVCLDANTGKKRWTRIAPADEIENFHAIGSPASCTPACNGKQVFSFFGSYGLLCYDLEGELLWERKMGPFQDEFGAASSPVLAEGLVLLNEDHDVGSFLIAIDQKTGEQVWRTERQQFTRSYSTPVISRRGDETEVIVAGSLQLTGYDLESGKRKWWVSGLSRIVDPTPTIVDQTLYIATWTPGGDPSQRISMAPFSDALKSFDKNRDGKIVKAELPEGSPVIPRFFRVDLNQDAALDQAEWERHASVFARAQNVAMAVRLGGQGDITGRAVQWIQRRGLPTVPSSVVYQGVLYMVKDGGIITSLDISNGEILQQGRARGPGNYYASLVAGDGKVYLASERGVITVLRAGRKWTPLSSHDFQERIMATPVLSQGRIIVRTDKAIYCLASQEGR